jgi:type I restriction enzyme R subunit
MVPPVTFPSEQEARVKIDELLTLAGWVIQQTSTMNLAAADGVAVEEFQTEVGPADYVLFHKGRAVGIIEAKRDGTTLSAVEPQTRDYASRMKAHVNCPVRPLPFLYESTGKLTYFTNGLDHTPQSRRVFAFHRPEVLASWLDAELAREKGLPGAPVAPTLQGRMRHAPQLIEAGLWPPQIRAIKNLEASTLRGQRRALIQMATGSGKTYTAITALYRLIRFGGARRALFLVDRGNLGRQAYQEFQGYTAPDDGRKFHELFPVTWLTHNKVDPVNRVVISTIQRLYSVLKGDPDFEGERDEGSAFFGKNTPNKQMPVEYTPAVPPDFFDLVVVDECHRSIYSLWSQVLDYFDATMIGLTATPSKQTYGFFDGNLVSEYRHEHAVRDRVNVPYEIYEIRTKKTLHGGNVVADDNDRVKVRSRRTRAERWDELDEDFSYAATQLDQDVVAPDQIRTILTELRDVIATKLYPGRVLLPKTLIFAKDDSHADDVLRAARTIFSLSNTDAVKITYKAEGGGSSSGSKASESLIKKFRASTHPRLAVTVDMIATGTDIKPLELVVFMRTVGSRLLYEQMLGRGVRVMTPADFQGVSGAGLKKTHFVVVDCVGVTKRQKTDPPVIRKPSLSLKQLLARVTEGDRTEETLSTLAGRLHRMDQQLDELQHDEVTTTANGTTLAAIVEGLLTSVDPVAIEDLARERFDVAADQELTDDQLEAVTVELRNKGAEPLATNPDLRELLLTIRLQDDQYFDHGQDQVDISRGLPALAPDYDPDKALVSEFQSWVAENRDELEALRILYAQPQGERLTREAILALTTEIAKPPRQWTPDRLWEAYQRVEKAKRRSAYQRWVDIVSLARHAMNPDQELVPFADQVHARFAGWLRQQEQAGRSFDEAQMRWLLAIRDRVAADAEVRLVEMDRADEFKKLGGLEGAMDAFEDELPSVVAALNEELVA